MTSICLAVLPGFGMQGSDIVVPESPSLRVENFDLAWNVSESFSSVAAELAPRLSKWAKAQVQGDELVIYGFSVGADLLMEMVLTTKKHLVLPPKASVVLADPNINRKTCFITGKAISPDCKNIDDFIGIIQKLTDNAKTTEEEVHWRRYLDAIKNNSANLAWSDLKNIATTIVEGADVRFMNFLEEFDNNGIRPSGKQLFNIVLSTDVYKEFAKHYPAKRDLKWINSNLNMQHFNLSDPGQIKAIVEATIEKRRCANVN